MPEVLLIDDNEEILSANAAYLTAQGFRVTCANTGIKAITLLDMHTYDCIVLDVLLPDLDGFAICKAARTVTHAPILFLSCLDAPDDKVNGLSTGGDDYMTKPYSLKELTARIRALLRRGEGKTAPAGNVYVDKDNRILHVYGKNVLLSEKELKLFLLFYENPGTFFSKEDILERIWGNRPEIGNVAVMVLRLRRKIAFAEPVIGIIETHYKTGYCLISPDASGAT
jgi:DNA-binding response OmpR family regulator